MLQKKTKKERKKNQESVKFTSRKRSEGKANSLMKQMKDLKRKTFFFGFLDEKGLLL